MSPSSFPPPGSSPSPRAPGGGAPGLARVLGAAALAGALVLGVSGCELRVGDGLKAVVPKADAAESSRDSLARQATLIASTAQAVSQGGGQEAPELAQVIAVGASSQAQSLGGVWQPWAGATAVPTSFPTVAPLATASPGAGTEELVAALSQGVELARQACLEQTTPETARAYASLVVSWSLWLEALSPQSLTGAGRDTTALSQPLPEELLLAYDSARYTLQTVAARSGEADQERATADWQAADRVVRASVALGGGERRLPAYAPPATGDDGGATEQAWAREVELTVLRTELDAVASLEGQERQQALAGAVDAALRAQGWGAGLNEDAFPGLEG